MTTTISPAQASDEPMRAAFFAWFAEHGSGHQYKEAQDAFCAGYRATPRATADVERDAERWRFRKEFLKNEGAIVWTLTRCRLRRNGELVSEGANEEAAIDAAIAATKGAKP